MNKSNKHFWGNEFIACVFNKKVLFLPCIAFTLILLIPLASFAADTPTFFSPLAIKPGSINQFVQPLAALALLSVFLERAMEIASKSFDEGKKIMSEVKRKKWVPLITLVLGILISLIGVRGLEPFFEVGNNPQGNLFRFIDVVLTGTLISGGTAGIHKILTSLTAFLDVNKVSAEAEKAKVEAKKTLTP
jgi:uncharacterized membrane protein (DUF441 family)